MASRKPQRTYLYIKEWMREKKVSDDDLANSLNISRATVSKWCNQQHRLNPQKIAAIAGALGIRPEQLWSPPSNYCLTCLLPVCQRDPTDDSSEGPVADHPRPADPDLERGRAVYERLRANGDVMAACIAWIEVTFDGSARERFLAAKERRRLFRVVR